MSPTWNFCSSPLVFIDQSTFQLKVRAYEGVIQCNTHTSTCVHTRIMHCDVLVATRDA